jgi:hypothetical protein
MIDETAAPIIVQQTISGRWAIRQAHRCMNIQNGAWICEPPENEINERIFHHYRADDLEEAEQIATSEAQRQGVDLVVKTPV